MKYNYLCWLLFWTKYFNLVVCWLITMTDKEWNRNFHLDQFLSYSRSDEEVLCTSQCNYLLFTRDEGMGSTTRIQFCSNQQLINWWFAGIFGTPSISYKKAWFRPSFGNKGNSVRSVNLGIQSRKTIHLWLHWRHNSPNFHRWHFQLF